MFVGSVCGSVVVPPTEIRTQGLRQQARVPCMWTHEASRWACHMAFRLIQVEDRGQDGRQDMENHAHRRPFNVLGSNEVSKEWLWMEPGRKQNPTLRCRAGQKSAKAMRWDGPNERDRK